MRRMRRRRPPTPPRQLLPPPVRADRILLCSIVVSTAPRRGGDKVWRLRQRRCLRSTSAHCSLGGRIGRTMRAAALQRRMTTTLTRKQGVTSVISWRSSSANFGKGVLGGGERQQRRRRRAGMMSTKNVRDALRGRTVIVVVHCLPEAPIVGDDRGNGGRGGSTL